MNWRHLKLWVLSLNPKRYAATKCGHRTKRTGRYRAFGEHVLVRMSLNEGGSVDYCLDCISKMAIRCAWCGEPIFIGDWVSPDRPKGDWKAPSWAVIHPDTQLRYVGCARDACGYWQDPLDPLYEWLPNEAGTAGCVVKYPSLVDQHLAKMCES